MSSYREGFLKACELVYPPAKLGKILQDRFSIPNDTDFNADKFYQAAAELSVSNHIKNSFVKGFTLDKKVNPPKDVDIFFELPPLRISVEVKCAVEAQPSTEALVMKTAGRVPDYLATFHDLKTQIELVHRDKTLGLAKNKDLTMKEFLISAHNKFFTSPTVDDLNILFIACGDYSNINDWYMYLYGYQGFFTANPFHLPSEFKNVDVVILSNVKYLHSEAREFHDWTLRDAFLLPFVNPHGRSTLLTESVMKGLSIFNHHLKWFATHYSPSWHRDVPDEVRNGIKVITYVQELLSSEKDRFFPVRRPK